MEFGVDFDDSLFETSKKKISSNRIDSDNNCNKIDSNIVDTVWKPKWENPEWFLHSDYDIQPDDCSSNIKNLEVIRMRAYHFYYKNIYDKALRYFLLYYDTSKNSGPSTEALESIIRCYIKLGDFEKAEHFGRRFTEIAARNYDQTVQATILLADLHEAFGQWQHCLIHVISLLNEFDNNADLWLRFAKNLKLLRNNSTQSSSGMSKVTVTPGSDSCCILESLSRCSACQTGLYVASLVRADSILYRTFRTAIGFSKDRNEHIRDQIAKALVGFAVELIEKAKGYVSCEVVHSCPEFDEMDGERRLEKSSSQEGNNLVRPTVLPSYDCTLHFLSKWFSWITVECEEHSYLSLQDC